MVDLSNSINTFLQYLISILALLVILVRLYGNIILFSMTIKADKEQKNRMKRRTE